jgi:hypothetical protein
MPGGLLNIIAYGNQNIILNGNPTKTFFKATYAKYTNFGIQKFRTDYNGSRSLNLNESSTFTFKIERQAELLMDTYLVFTLPDIYSTILPPEEVGDIWKPYHFRWIHNIGTSIIEEVTFRIGGQVIQRFSGEYLKSVVERDYDEAKKKMFYDMTGNVKELNMPEYYEMRNNNYPNVYYNNDIAGPEPSIRGRKIYVPLPFWFSNSSKVAFPLVCLQYNDAEIEVTLRPIREIFTINDIRNSRDEYTDPANIESELYNKTQPNFSLEKHQMYRFLQPPPTVEIQQEDYSNTRNDWDFDLHLISNYAFLTAEESRTFAMHEQKYLIKDVKEDIYKDIFGSQRVKLETNAMVSNWMWFFRRSDVNTRNDWSNYTNWPGIRIPYDVIIAPEDGGFNWTSVDGSTGGITTTFGPGKNIFESSDDSGETSTEILTNHRITQTFTVENVKYIMTKCAILLDGKYRENELDSGVFNYIEKFRCSNGYTDQGIYNYNFCLNTSRTDLQPSGAINLSKFKNIEIEFTTIVPNTDPDAEFTVYCDDEGGIISTVSDDLYMYTYELHIFEERYNILRFMGGNAGLLFAR